MRVGRLARVGGKVGGWAGPCADGKVGGWAGACAGGKVGGWAGAGAGGKEDGDPHLREGAAGPSPQPRAPPTSIFQARHPRPSSARPPPTPVFQTLPHALFRTAPFPYAWSDPTDLGWDDDKPRTPVVALVRQNVDGPSG